jgi:hypothetical protein
VLGVSELIRPDILRTLGAIAKTPDDQATIAEAMGELGYAEPASA